MVDVKIKYRHLSEPEKEKIYDTVKSLRNNPFIDKTQEEFDKFELERMSALHNAGIIISYEVIEDTQEVEDE